MSGSKKETIHNGRYGNITINCPVHGIQLHQRQAKKIRQNLIARPDIIDRWIQTSIFGLRRGG